MHPQTEYLLPGQREIMNSIAEVGDFVTRSHVSQIDACQRTIARHVRIRGVINRLHLSLPNPRLLSKYERTKGSDFVRQWFLCAARGSLGCK